MTPELKQHLEQVEKAVQAVKPILGKHGYTDEPRNVVVIAFLSILIQYHEAFLSLNKRARGRVTLRTLARADMN